MSTEAMAIALHHSKATGTAKLVLLGIANHDGDGGAWPAVATLAKYAGISDRRNIQRALQKLESLGEIRRIVQGGGDHAAEHYERPNLYKFLLTCPPDCDGSKNHKTARSKAVRELAFTDAQTPRRERRPAADAPPAPAASAPPKPSLELDHKKHRSTRLIARDGLGACGHRLVDDRHCYFGCAPAAVTGERVTA